MSRLKAISLLIFGFVPISLNFAAERNVVNQSGISWKIYDRPDRSSYPEHVCFVTRKGAIDLSPLGLTADDLPGGVQCAVGDYDGNGFLDFAFFNFQAVPAVCFEEPCTGVVYFFKGKKVLYQTSVGVKTSEVRSQREKDRSVLKCGTGGDTDYFYTFDQIMRSWQESGVMSP